MIFKMTLEKGCDCELPYREMELDTIAIQELTDAIIRLKERNA